MSERTTVVDLPDPVALAAEHGLEVDGSALELVEAGLDYRVGLATAADGRRWVLRMPRRPDVSEGMAAEARILDLVRPHLAAEGIAVPDWRIRTDRLIAYPLLPGGPGLTMRDGAPVWHMEPDSPDYAERIGRLLARLHAVPVAEAAAAGVEVRTPDAIRGRWSEDVSRVREAFDVAPALAQGWQEWLDDDASWPRRAVLTHGEIYPAHVLMDDDGGFTGVLDWTTARVDDPARDFAIQGGLGHEALRIASEAYVAAGGDSWPHLAVQSRRLLAAAPIGYALYALTTGDDEHLAAARAMVNPQE